jgi:hypothetical protein
MWFANSLGGMALAPEKSSPLATFHFTRTVEAVKGNPPRDFSLPMTMGAPHPRFSVKMSGLG